MAILWKLIRTFLTPGLALTGLFLSAWIVLLSPIELCLPLSVGAPEVSPWLLALNIFTLALTILGKRQGFYPLLIACSSLALLFSSLPLIQLPSTIQATQIAMETGLGTQYLEDIPIALKKQFRPQPFSIFDAFMRIPIPNVRQLSNIEFAQPDGVRLSMEIFQPPKPGTYPGIVVIYGGAWRRGKPTANAEFNAYMADHGYVVWAIDYRHAPQYRYPSQIEDVETALEFIKKHAEKYETDPQRLALMGRSAGAHLAMLAAYAGNSTDIKAVVNYYGPVDLRAGYKKPPQPDPIGTRTVLDDFLGGSPNQYPEAYQKASPLSYVVRPMPPTLLIYGSRDHIVEAQYGQQLYQKLIQVGSPAVYLEIPWADHAFDAVFNGISNQLALFHTERFLATALKTTDKHESGLN